jgi:hypothetical protein
MTVWDLYSRKSSIHLIDWFLMFSIYRFWLPIWYLENVNLIKHNSKYPVFFTYLMSYSSPLWSCLILSVNINTQYTSEVIIVCELSRRVWRYQREAIRIWDFAFVWFELKFLWSMNFKLRSCWRRFVFLLNISIHKRDQS